MEVWVAHRSSLAARLSEEDCDVVTQAVAELERFDTDMKQAPLDPDASFRTVSSPKSVAALHTMRENATKAYNALAGWRSRSQRRVYFTTEGIPAWRPSGDTVVRLGQRHAGPLGITAVCDRPRAPTERQSYPLGVFDRSRRIELDDGRTLVVAYQGERHGWGAYIPGETKRPTLAGSPVEAIASYLELSPEHAPAWARRLSERLQRELGEAPRYACDCCGNKTLLNSGRYEICDVCGWEDDRCDNNRRRGGPEAMSGPNRVSLSQARANFGRFGAAKDKTKKYVRNPRPEEHPSP
jgi:Cysteine-rich CPCC